ncbi:ABC transporter permease [Corynebacterium sp. 335C]
MPDATGATTATAGATAIPAARAGATAVAPHAAVRDGAPAPGRPSFGAAVAANLRRFLAGALRDRAALANVLVTPALMYGIMRALFGDLMAAAQGLPELDPLPLAVMLVLASQLMNGISASAHDIRERDGGIAARVATTPRGTAPMIAATWVVSILRSLVTGLSVLLMAVILGLRLHSWAGFLWLLAVLGIGALVAASLTVLIGAVGAAPESAMGAMPLVMAATFLNGGMVPVDRFVEVVRPIARHNPLTRFAQAAVGFDDSPARAVLDAGVPAHQAWICLAWAAGLVIVFLLGAKLGRRRPVMS